MDLLKDIIRCNVAYCDDVAIWYDGGHEYIQIVDRDGLQDDIILQGDEATDIIEQAKKLYKAQGDITLYEALCHFVKPIIESLWS